MFLAGRLEVLAWKKDDYEKLYEEFGKDLQLGGSSIRACVGGGAGKVCAFTMNGVRARVFQKQQQQQQQQQQQTHDRGAERFCFAEKKGCYKKLYEEFWQMLSACPPKPIRHLALGVLSLGVGDVHEGQALTGGIGHVWW